MMNVIDILSNGKLSLDRFTLSNEQIAEELSHDNSHKYVQFSRLSPTFGLAIADIDIHTPSKIWNKISKQESLLLQDVA